VMMDGGSNLNILYAHTVRLMGIRLDHCGPARRRSMASRQASASSPLGRLTYQFGSAHRTISARKRSPSMWWGSGVRTMPSLGGHATPSLWWSRTTRTSR
jgi:hypothetical protein